MNRTHRLIAATALAGSLLAGCSTMASAPRADASAGKAQAALARGDHSAAITNAEAAVAADPRNATWRATLGAAYLQAGRFASAATSYDDAMKLGDSSPRTALSLALAQMGQGKMRDAAALLNDWEDEIATADLGLALALVGQPERGIHLMGNAIRNGENTAKMRQNLAYAYALGGRWREARLMAQQDVPADKVGERIQQWAELAVPEAWHLRIAHMLQVPAGARDAGQPTQLALANSPATEQLVAEAAALSQPEPMVQQAELPPLAAAGAELPALHAAQPATRPAAAPSLAVADLAAPAPAQPASFVEAFATPAPSGGSIAAVVQDAIRFARSPAVQAAPVRHGAKPPVAAATQRTAGTHLVQLGSFASEQGARRAWGIYVKNHPELAGHQMVISQAVVNGKNFWRVAAGGFNRQESAATCGRVKARGAGCLAYAANRTLPGTVGTGVQLARR
jgi:Flp pilus assembly protein TadD/cell division protein FtsN